MKTFLLCLLAALVTTLATTSCTCCPGVDSNPQENQGGPPVAPTKKAGGY